MDDILKLKDALEKREDKLVLSFGSTRVGRFIIDPYNSSNTFDLKKDRKAIINSEKYKDNPNVVFFEKYFSEFVNSLPKNERWKYEYYPEVPFRNPNTNLYSSLYSRFGGVGSGKVRKWFRVDYYFPVFGIALELDSKTYHADIAIDQAKENILFHTLGLPTPIRMSLASGEEWEVRHKIKHFIKYLKSLQPMKYPFIDYNGIIESWDADNLEIIPFFPYIEALPDFFCSHDELYSRRTLYLGPEAIPNEALKITLTRESIRKQLQEVYSRVENINLVFEKP
jgi:hypothetical protein